MKNLLIFIAGGVVSLILFATVGLAYAQTQTPPAGDGYFSGMMGRFGGQMMGGRWGNQGNQFEGSLHDYMVEAFAEGLGIQVEDLEAFLTAGMTMQEIATEKGFSTEEFQDLLVEARKTALANAVSDGVITQEQADWMINRMNQKQTYGFGDMPCHRSNGWGRWNQSPSLGWNSQPTPQP